VTASTTAGSHLTSIVITGFPVGGGGFIFDLSGLDTDGAGTGGASARLTFEATPTAGAYNHILLSAAATAVTSSENIGTSDFLTVGIVPTAGASAGIVGSGTGKGC